MYSTPEHKPSIDESLQQIKALCDGQQTQISILANVASYLFWTVEDINWVGFYLLDNGKLTLGPFHGKPACIEIPLGKGVCGTAAHQDKTIVVPDVSAFEGHIACDPESRSELVIPLHLRGRMIGVLDVDSAEVDRFLQSDVTFFEQIASCIEESFERITLPVD